MKITIALSKSSVAFFKEAAAKHGSHYQRMIKNLLDYYTVRQQGHAARGLGTGRAA